MPPPACHAPGALSVHLGSGLTHGSSSKAGLEGSTAPAPLPCSHREMVLSLGLLEGQWKDSPCPWVFQAPSPWLTPAEGQMTQCPRSLLFPGRSQGQGRESGHLLGGWGQETQAASPALPLSHCVLGPVTPHSGPPHPPSPGQGQWSVLWEATERVLELPVGHTQHGTAHGETSEASPVGPPTLTGGWGRGRGDVGSRAWRLGCPTVGSSQAEQALGLQQNQGSLSG